MSHKKNYKLKHLLIVSTAIILVALIIVPSNIPNIIITIIQVVPIVLFSGPYEKIDELVEDNLNKANKYTMYLLLFMLIIFSLLGTNKVNIPVNVFSCTACVAVAFRSILFIWFDRNLNIDKGEQQC